MTRDRKAALSAALKRAARRYYAAAEAFYLAGSPRDFRHPLRVARDDARDALNHAALNFAETPIRIDPA